MANKFLSVLLCMPLLTTGLQAKVASISLGEMAAQSDVILVAQVERVAVKAGVKVARIRAIQFVKGKAGLPIVFVAEPTWNCDTSVAAPGERVLLYLTAFRGRKEPTLKRQNLDAVQTACQQEGTQLYVLAHSGRGRIQLILNKGKWVAPVTPGDSSGLGLNVNLYLPRPINTVLTSPGHRAVSLADLISRSKIGGR